MSKKSLTNKQIVLLIAGILGGLAIVCLCAWYALLNVGDAANAPIPYWQQQSVSELLTRECMQGDFLLPEQTMEEYTVCEIYADQIREGYALVFTDGVQKYFVAGTKQDAYAMPEAVAAENREIAGYSVQVETDQQGGLFAAWEYDGIHYALCSEKEIDLAGIIAGMRPAGEMTGVWDQSFDADAQQDSRAWLEQYLR